MNSLYKTPQKGHFCITAKILVPKSGHYRGFPLYIMHYQGEKWTTSTIQDRTSTPTWQQSICWREKYILQAGSIRVVCRREGYFGILTVIAAHQTTPLNTSPVTLMVPRCISLVTRTLTPTACMQEVGTTVIPNPSSTIVL